MYSDVLLAADGSDCARAATSHAIDLAATYGATLHALYVIETRVGYDSDIVDPATIEADLRTEGEAVLEAVDAESRERDVTLVDRIRKGVPEREIAEYVVAEDVGIVVLGSRGRSAFKTSCSAARARHSSATFRSPSCSSPTTTRSRPHDRLRIGSVDN